MMRRTTGMGEAGGVHSYPVITINEPHNKLTITLSESLAERIYARARARGALLDVVLPPVRPRNSLFQSMPSWPVVECKDLLLAGLWFLMAGRYMALREAGQGSELAYEAARWLVPLPDYAQGREWAGLNRLASCGQAYVTALGLAPTATYQVLVSWYATRYELPRTVAGRQLLIVALEHVGDDLFVVASRPERMAD